MGDDRDGEATGRVRLKKGLAQKELAEMVEVNEATVRNWERYETMPSQGQDRVRRLCAQLGLDFDDVQGQFPRTGRLRGSRTGATRELYSFQLFESVARGKQQQEHGRSGQ